MVANHFNFLFESTLTFYILDTSKSVSHQSNQNIHKYKLKHKRGAQESKPRHSIIKITIAIVLIITHTKQVSTYGSIDWSKTKNWTENRIIVFYFAWLVHYKECICKRANANEKHDHERSNILQDFLDHPYETCCCFKQSHPVEHFDPHEKDCPDAYAP